MVMATAWYQTPCLVLPRQTQNRSCFFAHHRFTTSNTRSFGLSRIVIERGDPINGCMTKVQPLPPTIIRRND